jgi:hypothetical protein
MEVKVWLEEARKTKLQVGNSIDSCNGPRRLRENRRRTLHFLKGTKEKNSLFVYTR